MAVFGYPAVVSGKLLACERKKHPNRLEISQSFGFFAVEYEALSCGGVVDCFEMFCRSVCLYMQPRMIS